MGLFNSSLGCASVRYPTLARIRFEVRLSMNTKISFLTDIVTSRLRLRCFEKDDAPFVLRLLNEPSFHEFIGDRGVRTLDDAVGYLERGPMASYAQHGHGLMHVSLMDGTPIGMCGILRRDGLEHPDVGFALAPEHWGCGYTLEASRAVITHARSVLGIGTLLAITAPHNLRSMRVLEKLGFSLTETRVLTAGATPVNVFRSDKMSL